MNSAQQLHSGNLRFDAIIGTGAIGSGILFLLEDNHLLGRNESRLGVLSPAKDFAKLHIILHYIAVFLADDAAMGLKVYPVSRVGDDEIGHKLMLQMAENGMSLDGVHVQSDLATLFSACFQYPDSTGGNITTSNSASNYVTGEDISGFVRRFSSEQRLLMLAAPEAPMEARIRLLKEGRKRSAFNVAAVLSAEVDKFIESGGVELTDLLSLNIDEARSVCGLEDESLDNRHVVELCINVLRKYNANLVLSVTDGPHGSFLLNEGGTTFIPAFATEVVSTAGAGDAYLSGMIVGLCHGLQLVKGHQDTVFGETPLQSAVELGVLFASSSLTSIDSIHLGANRQSLRDYIQKTGLVCSEQFRQVFQP